MTTLSVEELLAIKLPRDLFGKEPDPTASFKRMRSLFHPDKCKHPDCDKAFKHLGDLYDRFTKPKIMAEEGINFRYDIMYGTELYECYVNSTHALFKVKPGKVCDNYLIIYQEFKKRISSSDRLKKDFDIVQSVQIKRGADYNYILVDGVKGLVPLSKVLEYFNGQIEWQTAVWIVTSMFNNACLYNHMGYVGNAFSPDTYFIDLEKHYGWDMGGFFFHCKKGEKLVALSKQAMDIYPIDAIKNKVSHQVADIRLIQRTASIVFGDKSGTGLKLTNLPKELINFIQHPATEGANAVDWYGKWMETIEKAFGKRKFYISKAMASDILAAGL